MFLFCWMLKWTWAEREQRVHGHQIYTKSFLQSVLHDHMCSHRMLVMELRLRQQKAMNTGLYLMHKYLKVAFYYHSSYFCDRKLSAWQYHQPNYHRGIKYYRKILIDAFQNDFQKFCRFTFHSYDETNLDTHPITYCIISTCFRYLKYS